MDTGGRTAGLVELALVLAALGATVLEPNLGGSKEIYVYWEKKR